MPKDLTASEIASLGKDGKHRVAHGLYRAADTPFAAPLGRSLDHHGCFLLFALGVTAMPRKTVIA